MNNHDKQRLIGILDSEMDESAFKKLWYETAYSRKLEGDATMLTYTGKPFDFDDPKVNIKDIAHSLSQICRFGGHCEPFYSVAEHCLAMSYFCQHKRWGLLHDAAEAYTGDIVTPLKSKLGGIKEIETRILIKVAITFGLEWSIPQEVSIIDKMMYFAEKLVLMDGIDSSFVKPRGDMRLVETLFLSRFQELF